MKLTRIHLAHFRKFREPLEIGHLNPGLNVLTGPNEAGKSTIAAAIRAAFFERHRSKVVDNFRPVTDPQASPAITLEFNVAGTDYRLFKQFLARARCTLEFGVERLDGEAAEDYLAKLMGYQYASRGRSRADDWGIPGLLWTEQGRAQELDEAIAHALAHLRAALGDTGASAPEDASELLAQVARERNALLTASGGAPRGVYAEALKGVQTLRAEHQTLAHDSAHYRAAVDQLAALRAAHQTDAAEQPWEALRAAERTAQTQLDEAQQWLRQRQALEEKQEQFKENIQLFLEQLQQLDQEEKTLIQRQAARADAEADWQQAKTAAAHCAQQHDAAQAALAHATHVLEQCRARDARLALHAQHASVQQQRAAIEQHVHAAEAAHQALQTVQTRLAGAALDDADLNRARQLSRARSDVQIRLQAHATRLRFGLDAGVTLLLDGEALTGSGERHLSAAATLTLPGAGTVTIEPGGEDLHTLGQQRQQLDADWDALLKTLQATTLQELETRHLQAQAWRLEAVQHEQSLRLHAPQGIDALKRAAATLSAQQDALAPQLRAAAVTAIPPAADAAATLPATAQAQAACQAAQTAADRARERRHQAQLAQGKAQTRAEHTQTEWNAAHALMDAGARAARVADVQRRLVEARARAAHHARELDALTQKIAQTRVDLLEQDRRRTQRSAEQLERAHRERAEQLLRLETELQTLGARGLDERAAAVALALAQAERKACALARRARALDHLWQHLRAAQQHATQALQQPLQVHLRHYLDVLFPGAALTLDEQLQPNALHRRAGERQQLELLHALSFGAREQLGLIGRLACADLLRAAGRPTLLILDDALVHTDSARLAQMKRILFDAATRHQILLFSCHEAWWRDLGVLPQDVAALASGRTAA